MILLPPDFHFLRPWWFMALVPCAVLLYLLWRYGGSSRNLEDICDPSLLSHLIMDSARSVRPWPILLIGTCWLAAAAALAGPVWEKQPMPIYHLKTGRVLLLDLSPSMAAQDIKPSRLKRAKFKIRDMLKQGREGFTGLVVFSSEAYVVVPLTDDVATIEAMLPALSPDVMPEQGDNVKDGLERAAGLLSQSGIRNGDIVLVTDGVSDMASCIAEINRLRSHGVRVNVLGMGTTHGAPVPNRNGGFLHDAAGSPLISKLNVDELRELARAGGGVYASLTADDSDIKRLIPEMHAHGLAGAGRKQPGHADQWREQGAWLVIPLLFAALAGFRRGWLLALFIMLLLGSASPVRAFSWQDLWHTREQQAWDMYSHGRYREAASLFRDRQRKAAALYRAGQYAEAAKLLESIHGADAAYNRGNSLARTGKLEDAVTAYDQALEQNPDDADAAFNRNLVKKLLEQQKRQAGQESRNSGKNDSGKNNKQAGKNQKQQNSEKEQGRDNQGNRGEKGAKNNTARGSSGENNDNSSKDAQHRKQQTRDENTDSRKNADRAMQQEREEKQPGSSGRDGQKIQESGKAVSDASQSVAGNNTELEKPGQTEKEMALEQWLRQIPDDPSGLLRRKFFLEYQKRRQGR